MRISRRRLPGAAGAAAFTGGAHARPVFPTRPVRLVIRFGPGGGTDNLIRLLEPYVSRTLGQPLVIENRAGTGGIVGTEIVARAEPDGLAYASGGNGAPTHLMGEMLKAGAGIDLAHLPYRCTGPAMNDLIAGHVPLGVNGLSASAARIQSGRVRALAVTGNERAGAFPDIPTFCELGLREVDLYTRWRVLTHAGTPEPVITRLAQAFNEAVQRSDLRGCLNELGYVPAGTGPERYGETIRRETARITAVIRAPTFGLTDMRAAAVAERQQGLAKQTGRQHASRVANRPRFAAEDAIATAAAPAR